MGSYRQWATMMQHVHKTHAEGITEEDTEEFLLARDEKARAKRELPEHQYIQEPGAAQA